MSDKYARAVQTMRSHIERLNATILNQSTASQEPDEAGNRIANPPASCSAAQNQPTTNSPTVDRPETIETPIDSIYSLRFSSPSHQSVTSPRRIPTLEKLPYVSIN